MTATIRLPARKVDPASEPSRQTPPEARPLVLNVDPDPVFGMFHPAAEPATGTAILICPPWGWDEVTSYRSRRAWAERLAAEGRPTLRIDLPGAGDSGGSPSDAGRVTAWANAIRAAAAWLAAQEGVTSVVAIGLGLGGLLTARAIVDGAPIDAVVLWSVPETGRAFLRELRAFASLQATRLEPDGEARSDAADGLEVGGFELSAETRADLEPLDLAALLRGRVDRVLLLDRDGMGHTSRLAGSLATDGAIVTQGPGPGWSDMVFHPEQYHAPAAVMDRVSAWLGEARMSQRVAPRPAAPDASAVLELPAADTGIRETAIRVRQPYGDLFGIAAEPLDGRHGDVCAVFLNAGAVRRIGPNRMWVEAARSWAAAGIPSVRMDLEGIGDADGDPDRYRNVGNFYTDAFGASVTAILDDLVEGGFGTRFALIGLCAGAYWSFHTGAADPRVVEVVILNPRAMIWDDGLLDRREANKVGRLLDPSTLGRVARGEVSIRRAGAISGAIARRILRAAARRVDGRLPQGSGSGTQVDPVRSRLDALRDREVRVVIAFSGDEPVRGELDSDGVLAELNRWPNVELIDLPGRDHTLRPLKAQRAASDILDRERDRLRASSAPEV